MQWYYAVGSERKGPVEEAEFARLVKSGVIQMDALVWNESLDGWKPLSEVFGSIRFDQPAGAAVPAGAPAGTGAAGDPGWYWGQGGQRHGPVPRAELDALYTAGTISANTLVWTQGMLNWQSFGRVRYGSGGVECVECKGTFPPAELVMIGGYMVCAGCKNLFAQRVREGMSLPGTVRYAGFWIRFGAYFIDSLILAVPNWIIGAIIGAIMAPLMARSQVNPDNPFATMAPVFMIQGVATLFSATLTAIYFIYQHAKWGQTLGKRVCKVKVVRTDGTPISTGQAVGRYFATWLSGLICYIGFFMAGFDEEKRALHDRLADTRVIYTE